MIEQKAKLNHLRQAPRKVRLITNLIKGASINEAEARLLMQPKRAAEPVLKLLRSAVANFKNNHSSISENRMFIKEIRVDGGPMLKRYLPRARGMATLIQKKSSHITIILGENEKEESKFKVIRPVKDKKDDKKVKEAKTQVKPEARDEGPKEKKEERGILKKVFRRKSV